MQNTLSKEIIYRLRIKETVILDAGLIILGSLFVAASAQLAIYLPFSPIPITGQTFAVLLTGALLGSKRGGLSVALYILEGLLGLPVFAGGTGGIAVLFGPTAGFLAGFIPAAALIGYLSEKAFDRKPLLMVAAFTGGQTVIYIFGILRLLAFVNYGQALQVGVLPFLAGDVVKAGLAMTLLPSGWKLLSKGK